ncbi:MAG: winged helix-turn-helix domain-containing protein [Aquabacterium sp.]
MPPSSYRFDRFELRLGERLLYRDGEPIGVGARAADVLAVLLAAQGRLVTKQELLERAWPNLVVEENNLQVQISALRKWVGADAITTVPGRGYRFCLPVEVDMAAAPQPLSASAAGAKAGAAPGASPSAVPRLSPFTVPACPARLWGREAERIALDLQSPAPLITIVGPAGIGKTALAQVIAHDWQPARKDGAVWVELAGITQGEHVCAVVAQALGVPVPAAPADARAGEPAPDALVHALRGLHLLIVIDNAEHVADAVSVLAHAITQHAPDVRVLVTSQVPLKVPGERVFRLGPLSVPGDEVPPDEARQHGAVALFFDQVRASGHRMQDDAVQVRRVAALCRRLDGVALAIKLAASRVPLLGLQGVEDHLAERFRLLQDASPVVPARQQTLIAALTWSHGLLDEAERVVFRRLSVAAGGFSLALARALASDGQGDDWATLEALSTLVERSLVMADAGEWPRYRLLDTLREFAAIQLQSAAEVQACRERHARAMADIMVCAYDAYWQQADAPWLAQHACDIDNVRLALAWAQRHDPALGVRLLGAAGPLFMLLGLAGECRQQGELLEPHALAMDDDADAARFWLERSRLHWGIRNTAMHDMAERALGISRQMGHEMGVYLALRCMAGSGVLPPTRALQVLEDMARLEQPHWPARVRAQRMLAQVGVLRAMEHMAEARRACHHLLVTAEAAGLEGFLSAALSDLASVSLALGDTDGAMKACQQLLARSRHRRDNFVLHALAIVACVSFVKGDLRAARTALTDFMAASRSRGWEWLGLYAGLLALLAALEGRHEAAARLLGYAGRARERLGTRDVLTVYAWSRATALVKDALEGIVLQRLQDMGREMDSDAVCGWALASG